MTTSIQVNKKSIEELLRTGLKHKFVIPEYQRPYAWEEDQCQILWNDILHFSAQEKESTYFLGTIVSYKNEQGEQEIIDGQQRITTLFLLLRAIYKKLEHMTTNDSVIGLMNRIRPCLWDVDSITGKVDDYSKTHIRSLVITDEDNQTFLDILISGEVNNKAKDNYSINYIFFQSCINNYSAEEPLNFYKFCINILENCILLPIECDSQDTALTIFSTLNDRGLPLSDADIFKAKIYNYLENDQKNDFIEKWQELDIITKNADIKIQDLFYYYMFYLRAKEGDKDTTTPGLRRYFSRNSFQNLYKTDLMSDLLRISNLWTIINNREENENRYKEVRIKQSLSCLQNYPNEYWKYPITIYYLTYHTTENFSEMFANFLENLLAVFSASYIISPTVNAIKGKTLNLNYDILSTPQPKLSLNKNDKEEFERKLSQPHRSMVRLLLEVYAYKQQEELLPLKWEIEHILPKKWQNTSLYGYNENEVGDFIEQIGNKVPFEKKLNILAGNNYFNRKKTEYSTSKILLAKSLAALSQTDWTPEDIARRTNEMKKNIIEWFEDRRAFGGEDHKERITDEELKLIQKGENDVVEFKSSMRRSYKDGKMLKELEFEIIKTVSAFLNSKGGTLFIGVKDDGEILGLENDLSTFSKGLDGFLLHFAILIKTSIGADSHNYINALVKEVDNKIIVVVKVHPSISPVYTTYAGKEEFIIRSTAGSQSLSLSDTMQYITKHWSK